MAAEISLVISTFPDAETAHRIATELVTSGLAACGNILPAVRSVYRWEGRIEDAAETMVFFKTTAARFAEFQEKLRTLHPTTCRRSSRCRSPMARRLTCNGSSTPALRDRERVGSLNE